MPELHNPIIGREELSRWRTPVPDANTALVFLGNGQPTFTIRESQKGLTKGEILWGKYSLVYKVNLSDFPIAFNCNLPCATDAFDFQAEVRFLVSVREPEIIVRHFMRVPKKLSKTELISYQLIWDVQEKRWLINDSDYLSK